MVSLLGLKRRYLLALLAALFAAAYPAASRAEGDERQGSELFDGAGSYKALSAGGGARSRMSEESLKSELRERIDFNDHGSEKERAGYEYILDRLMDSPTARRQAEEFVKNDYRITFSFAEMPGSTVATVNGKKSVWGDRGVTYGRVPPDVQLNSSFLDYDRDRGVETFAHETFGHAVSGNALKGDSRKLNAYAVTEEENARIIGWLVGAELGTYTEQETWDYSANPDKVLENLAMAHPSYALKLTTEEMADPIPVYRERLARAEKLLATVPKRMENVNIWGGVVTHFVNVHKLPESSFRNIRDSLENDRKALPDFKNTLLRIRTALNERIAYFSSEEGQAALALLRKGAGAGFLRERDEEILAFRRQLEGQLAGKTPQSTRPPPEAGQVTWAQLKEALRAETNGCKYGGAK